MAGARYRRGGMYAADMAVYGRSLSEENTNEKTVKTLRRNLIIAMRQELTPQQVQCIRLYYVEGYNMTEISRKLGLHKSTVSRIIRSGESTLRRCLRFGAANLLDQAGIKAPYHSVRNLAKREGYENC